MTLLIDVLKISKRDLIRYWIPSIILVFFGMWIAVNYEFELFFNDFLIISNSGLGFILITLSIILLIKALRKNYKLMTIILAILWILILSTTIIVSLDTNFKVDDSIQNAYSWIKYIFPLVITLISISAILIILFYGRVFGNSLNYDTVVDEHFEKLEKTENELIPIAIDRLKLLVFEIILIITFCLFFIQCYNTEFFLNSLNLFKLIYVLINILFVSIIFTLTFFILTIVDMIPIKMKNE